MEIKDLHARQGNVEITADVIDKSQPRTFDKNGNSGKVCNAKIQDATGAVTLSLWNDDVDKVDIGDKIKLSNGYVGEYQGELQLSAGKFGKIEIIGKIDKPKQITKQQVQEDLDPEEFTQNEDLDVEEEDVF